MEIRFGARMRRIALVGCHPHHPAGHGTAVEGTREILQPLSDYSFGVSAPYTSASALSGSIPDTILALILMAFTALVAPV